MHSFILVLLLDLLVWLQTHIHVVWDNWPSFRALVEYLLKSLLFIDINQLLHGVFAMDPSVPATTELTPEEILETTRNLFELGEDGEDWEDDPYSYLRDLFSC